MKDFRPARTAAITILCCVLLAAAFAGCSFLPGFSDEGSRLPFSLFPESTTEPKLPDPPEPAEPEAPVVRYAPLDTASDYAAIFEGPEDTLLILPKPEIGDGQDPEDVSPEWGVRTLLIYDPKEGSVVNSLSLPFAATLSNHLFDDGTFLVSEPDPDGGTRYTFFDAAGQIKDELTFSEADFAFVSTDRRYAYFAARELFRADLSSGLIEKVALPAGMQVSYIEAMLPDSDRLLMAAARDHETCTALFDPESGELLFLRKGYLSYTGRTESGVILSGEQEEPYLFWDGEELRSLRDPPEETYEETSLDGGYCLFRRGDEAILFSPLDNAYAWMEDTGDPASDLYFIEDLDAFFRIEKNEDGELVPTLIRKSFLRFIKRSAPLSPALIQPVDGELLAWFEEAGERTRLSEELLECREKADTLEEKYGLRILLSNECAMLSQDAGFSVHPSSEWETAEEIESIHESLKIMDALFARYPKSFFLHFRKGRDNGLLFMLTGQIESTYGVIAYERYEFTSGTYEIVFDMSYNYDLKCTLIHELWHAVEDSTQEDFPYDEWNAVSPPGFSYQEQYENPEPIEGWTLFVEDPDKAYFVDEYSKTFAKEDRARVMEYFFGREEFRNELLKSPHLLKKYRILTDHIRRTVGDDSWPEKTAWEDIF